MASRELLIPHSQTGGGLMGLTLTGALQFPLSDWPMDMHITFVARRVSLKTFAKTPGKGVLSFC